MQKVIAILLLAGKGTRLKSSLPKQYIKIANKPVICHTIEVFEYSNLIDEIIIVINKDYLDFFKTEILNKYNFKKIKNIVLGGKERAFSVKNALDTLPLTTKTKDNILLIHDGVRPFVSKKVLEKGIAETKTKNAVVIGVKVKDTIKISKDGIISETPDRKNLWIAQTPQIFKLEILKKAYNQLPNLTTIPTDDSTLVEQIGYKVKMLEGNYENIKITTPEDLIIAETILEKFKNL